MLSKQYYIYILASRRNGTLYIGMTNELGRRVWEHREGLVEGFTRKYDVTHLVHFEAFENLNAALRRETHLKKWKRKWKLALIEKTNPEWHDLYASVAIA